MWGHTYKESPNALAKAAMTRQFVNVEIKTTRRLAKQELFFCDLYKWKERWSNSKTDIIAYESFPHFGTHRL